MILADDYARCAGITEVNAAKPIRICATCARWQSMGTGGPRTPAIDAPAVIRETGNGARIVCDLRIEGDIS